MDAVRFLIDFILHIDVHLADIARQAGGWTYGVVGLIVFCETGLVVMPFLPGDSLLFAAGGIAALPASGLNVHLMALILFVAAVLGDAVNYAVGRYIGTRITRFVKASYLKKTEDFYATYGGRTVVLARFVPIVRTFAPFVAGMGAMNYRTFLAYNVGGAFAWVGLFLYGGYFFANLPWVKERFSLVVLGVIAVSVLPIFVEVVRGMLRKDAPGESAEAAVEAADEVARETE